MSMRVLIGGASGLLGSALVRRLERAGHSVTQLVRRPAAGPTEVAWDPARGAIDRARLAGIEAAVNLAGATIGTRWTPARKESIRASRIDTTGLLSRALAELDPPPRTLVSASAIGYYGSRADEVLTEASPAGTGFLARLGIEWEEATAPASRAGIRVVSMRSGLVLAPHGGALARMLPPFRLGLGGPFGDGRAWWSWIALEDFLGAVEHVLQHDTLVGPVNFVAPNPLRNVEFVRTLARVLGRPAVLRVPAFALRALFGAMADEALLASTRVLPERLTASGFSFRFPDLEGALRWMLAPRRSAS